jgi:hypothetical protein
MSRDFHTCTKLPSASGRIYYGAPGLDRPDSDSASAAPAAAHSIWHGTDAQCQWCTNSASAGLRGRGRVRRVPLGAADDDPQNRDGVRGGREESLQPGPGATFKFQVTPSDAPKCRRDGEAWGDEADG